MSQCPRFGRLFGGCRFSPRYDDTAPTPAHIDALVAPVTGSELAGTRSITYVRDVCERCGKTVERQR